MGSEIALYAAVSVSVAVFAIHLCLALGVLLARLRDLAAPRGAAVPGRASVLVVARDEEQTLPPLLESLLGQSAREFEIVLVSDRSRDGTLQVMQEFRRRHGGRVKVLENREHPGNLGPKQFVLDLAVAASSGEILLFTDADCVVPRQWVEGTLRYFQDPRVGASFGQLCLPEGRSFLQRFQAFDQPLIHQWNTGSAGLGIAGGCFGNNLAARRSLLEQLGGFRALGYTLTEDAALVTAARKRGWRVAVSTRGETMIRTLPQGQWTDFVAQHLRWNGGGFYHPDFSSRAPYRLITLFLIASVLALPLAFAWPPLGVLPASSFCSVGLMGLLAALLCSGDRRRRGRTLLRLVPYTCLFMVFYGFVTLLSIFRLPPRWKGERLGCTPTGGEPPPEA